VNSSLPVTLEKHQFSARDLIGGDAALDFVNTVSGRDQAPRDRLASYTSLLEWAALVSLVPEKHLQTLEREAENEPGAAATALARAKALREALFAVITGTVTGKTPAKGSLALLRGQWIAGVDAHELRFDVGRLSIELRNDAVNFDLIAATIAYRMIEYVLPLPIDRLRICQGPNCSWVFIDSSKAGRRRWCDMAVCGNAAKARRFHARTNQRRSR
jgi:predicted RNA-binding Zn ribbon-like protein